MLVVPRLAPLLLLALPPWVSDTVAELLKLTAEVLNRRAFADSGINVSTPNASVIFFVQRFWYEFHLMPLYKDQ